MAILLGMQVEQLQINFMVGQAFAIAAASYFPLLFMSVWWRKLTMKGAATGMLDGRHAGAGGHFAHQFQRLEMGRTSQTSGRCIRSCEFSANNPPSGPCRWPSR